MTTPPASLPTMAELRSVIPPECFQPSLARSLTHAAVSVTLAVGAGVAAWVWIPMTVAWIPAWIAYALVVGTLGCGVWVLAHECGHGAFCTNDRIQNAVGFVLHSALLVPYFSWQRSHAVHHARTNHLTEGETHVPRRADGNGQRSLAVQRRLGVRGYAAAIIAGRLLAGWPLYLLVGATGGTSRGRTNHFWPWRPFSSNLFPDRWRARVVASALGVAAMVAVLVAWAVSAGSIWPVVALYGGPYVVTNAWLVTYTWLQHTGPDIPHYDNDEWSFVLGAFCSVDRPYGRLFDTLHHRIGSTHVAHHLFPAIPHYRAQAATEALAAAHPDLYRYDPTPVTRALWQAGTDCVAVARAEHEWRFDAVSTLPGSEPIGTGDTALDDRGRRAAA